MTVTVYTKPNCSFCHKALDLLSANGFHVNQINLDTPDAVASFKHDFPHVSTVPHVLVSDVEVGGYEQLNHMMTRRNNLLNQLRAGNVRLTFRKLNGDERVALATLHPDRLPETKGTGTEKAPNLNLIAFYDLEKSAWRSANITNIVEYEAA
jgi:glutaredoxin